MQFDLALVVQEVNQTEFLYGLGFSVSKILLAAVS